MDVVESTNFLYIGFGLQLCPVCHDTHYEVLLYNAYETYLIQFSVAAIGSLVVLALDFLSARGPQSLA